MEEFWRINQCTDTPLLSSNEQFRENNLISNGGTFGNSIDNAKKRLYVYAMERKFAKNKDFKTLYQVGRSHSTCHITALLTLTAALRN